MASKSNQKMAELIRRAFKESGMNMLRLSVLSRTRYASVHAFFTADRDPQLSTIQRWCDVLGLELHRTERKRK